MGLYLNLVGAQESESDSLAKETYGFTPLAILKKTHLRTESLVDFLLRDLLAIDKKNVGHGRESKAFG